ncbi:MAG: endolytic transglycosylase MltG [Ramlibacter sp.]|nr:endolytic transglycosylase MltG [Cryobacterium sp.]
MTNPPADPDRPQPEAAPSGWEGLLSGETETVHADSHDAAVPGPAEHGVSPSATSRRAARESRASGTRSSRRTQIGSEPPRRKSRRGAWVGLIVALVVVALVGGGVVLLQEPIAKIIAAVQGPADYTGTGTSKVVVMIHDGETGQDVANSLVDQDVVKSYEAFYSLLLKESPAPVFQPGAYQLAGQMSGRAALDALLDPANKLEQTVVIPEGTAAVDVLQLVSEGTSIPLADLQAAATDVTAYGLPAEATTLEGFLFPATYTFEPELTATAAIKTLVDRQFKALDEAGVAPENRWKTIVLASLIQREAGLTEDYYKVARVFLNRLDPTKWETGLLQSDATVAYGTGATHRVTTTDAERGDPGNAYNTYQHPGLPVGPISNPGDDAIDAAGHPADGPWLYFVTWNLDTGETIFSATAEEHDAAVTKWMAWMDEHPEYG